LGKPFGDRVAYGLAQPLAWRGAQELADPVGQLGLELGRLAAVDPTTGANDVSPADELVDQRLGDVLPRGCAEQLGELRQQRLDWQACASAPFGLAKQV